MTATEELRRLLDERGVEWCDSSDENVLHTTWNDMNCWFNEFPDGWTAWGMAKRGTPEQAIAATVGAGTCKVESSYAIEFGTLISPDYYEFEMSCGYRFRWSDNEPPDCCPGCGRKVVHGGS